MDILPLVHKGLGRTMLRICDIPNELIAYIFTFLSFENILMIRIVCRRWRDISNCPWVWNNKTVQISSTKGLVIVSNASFAPFVKRIKRRPVKDTSEYELPKKTKIVTINCIGSFPNLRHLDISNTYIPNLSPLQNCSCLEYLNISNTNVYNFDPLTKCTQLKTLYAGSLSTKHLPNLRALTNLEVLSLGSTNINDISPLTNLTSLNTLDLSNVEYVQDFYWIGKMISLTGLYLNGNRRNLRAIDFLSNCTNIKKLHLSCTGIYNIDALEKLTRLEELEMLGVRIAYVTPLINCINLTRLVCSGRGVIDKHILEAANPDLHVEWF